MSYIMVPGLKSGELPGTYLSLMPKELLELLGYYYIFPIRIIVRGGGYSYIDDRGINLSIGLSRRNGPHGTDNLLTIINLEKFLDEIKGSYYYPPITVYERDNKIVMLMTCGVNDMFYYYNEYETSQLKRKLQFILSQINQYKTQNMDSALIMSKISYYSY